MFIRKPQTMIAAFVIVFGLCAASSASAQVRVYTWRGADGLLRYSANPPGTPAPQRVAYRAPIQRSMSRPQPSFRHAAYRDRSPERFHRYDAYISEAARIYRMPVAFIRAVIRVESNFDPGCVSRTNARGLMQLMPATARSMGVRHVHDPRENILGGTRYLRILANHFNGDLALVLAAYNAGRPRVDRYVRGRQPLPEITVERYIPRTLMWYRRFLAE